MAELTPSPQDQPKSDDHLFKVPFLPKHLKKRASFTGQENEQKDLQNSVRSQSASDNQSKRQKMIPAFSIPRQANKEMYTTDEEDQAREMNKQKKKKKTKKAKKTEKAKMNTSIYAKDKEDVDSDGDIDEELAAVVANLTQKCKEQNLNPVEINKNVVLKPCPSLAEIIMNHCTEPTVTKPNTAKDTDVQALLNQPVYIYQLFFKDNDTLRQLGPKDVIVRADHTKASGGQDAEIFLADSMYKVSKDEFKKCLKNTKHGQCISLYNNTFFFVKRFVLLRDLPRNWFYRINPRDHRTEAPILEEIVERMKDLSPEQKKSHPKARDYPDGYPYEKIQYNEDLFWAERTIPIPAGHMLPEFASLDTLYDTDETPPPIDWDWEPDADTQLPPGVLESFYERKAEHQRQQKEKEEQEKRKQK